MLHVSLAPYRWGTIATTVVFASACFDTAFEQRSVSDSGRQVVTGDAGNETRPPLPASTQTQTSTAVGASATEEATPSSGDSSAYSAPDSGDLASLGTRPIEAGFGTTVDAFDAEAHLDAEAPHDASERADSGAVEIRCDGGKEC